jgi:trans-aconitate 2-methyltransferase
MKDAWNPAQYGRFADERSRPFYDLAAMVRGPVAKGIDLGCGPGRLTAELPAHVGVSDVLGIDNSPAMLEAAKKHERPGLRFELGDLGLFAAKNAYDLVFSNAALQWSGDHPALLSRLTTALRPGGQLAVQMPANADHEGASLADLVAHEEPFFSALGGAPPPDAVTTNVLAPEAYALILHRLGFAEQQVRLEVYLHQLESPLALVEWLRGAALTRFAKLLPTELFEEYLDTVRARLLTKAGDQRPYPFTFKRIFLWGRLPMNRLP